MSDVQSEPTEATVAPTEPATPESTPAEPTPEPTSAYAPNPSHPAHGPLDAIEDLAIKWGGDVMTEIRNLVGETRSLL